jgi:hypothetical protein
MHWLFSFMRDCTGAYSPLYSREDGKGSPVGNIGRVVLGRLWMHLELSLHIFEILKSETHIQNP